MPKRLRRAAAGLRSAPARFCHTITSAWSTADTAVRNAAQHARNALAERGFNTQFNLALVVALIATFAATTTYSASQWELRASSCDRAFAEATTYDLVRDQTGLSAAAENTRWRSEYGARLAEGRRLLDEATALRRNGTSAPARHISADALDIDAQMEFAAARAMKAVRDFTAPALPEPPTVRDTILRERCPHTGQPKSTGPSAVNGAMRDDATSIRKRSVSDAFAVMLFVFALALCTVADLVPVRLLTVLLASAAAVVTLGGIGVGVFGDDALLLNFIRGIILYAACAWLACVVIWRLDARDSARAKPVSEQRPDTGAGGARPGHTALLRNFRTTIVYLVTSAALLNGIAGAFYSDANGRANDAAANASAMQFEMVRASNRFQAKAYSAITGMTNVREALLRYGAVRTVRTEGAMNANVAGDGPLWNRDEIRWQSMLERLESVKPYSNNFFEAPIRNLVRGAWGPYRDTAYPERYFADQTVQVPAKLYALRDAFDEQSAAWDGRASGYLGALAMLAIAAYLFGESLRTIRSRGAYVLTTFGIGLVSAACVFGLLAYFQPIPPFDDAVPLPGGCIGRENTVQTRAVAASICFAAAELHAKERRASEALSLYMQAHSLRPGFSVARYLAVLTRISLPKADPLKTMIADERGLVAEMTAVGNAVPEQLLEILGYHEYLRAIQTNDRALLQNALTDLDEAKRTVLPLLPPSSLQYRLGVASLANHDPANARAQYESGWASFSRALRERKAGESHAAEDAELAGSAIADLERMRERCHELPWNKADDYCTHQGSTIGELERKIVRATWTNALPRSRLAFAHEKLDVTITPGGIGWRIPSPSEDRGSAVLVAIAYRWDSRWQMWSVLPDLTYQVDPTKLYRPKHWISAYRSRLIASDYADCLDVNATYRLELYRDGELVGRKEPPLPGRSEHFQGIGVREPGVAFCFPAGWVRAQVDPEKLALRYSAKPVTRKPPERGASVFAYFASRLYRSPVERATNERLSLRRAVDTTLRQLGRPQLADGGFRESSSRCGTYFDENWTSPHVDYVSDTITVLGKAWESPDGLIHVGVVWQAPGFPDKLSCNVLTSMTTVDRDAPITARETPSPVAAPSAPAFTYR